jgi:DNA-binding SARP family transcriptional activator
VEFRILGPLQVVDRGRTVSIGGARQRSLLALLLLNANDLVSADRLVEGLWGDEGGPASRNALQVAVSRLRAALGSAAERLVTQEPGYRVRVDAGELDAERFEVLVAQGRRQAAEGDATGAADTLGRAVGLWRGRALADFVYEPFAQLDIARLEELRISAFEDRVDADLAVGRGAELVGELKAAVAEHPLRERLASQLMLALYRCGRQAEALAAYRRTRGVLVDELGIEPGPELQHLENKILCQDASLELARAPAAPTIRARKVVTSVVIELRAGTVQGGSLDPEALENLVDRCMPQIGVAVKRHGGVIERAAGERVVAVFGIPRVHEDDVARAGRAALGVVETMGEIGESESQSDLCVAVAEGISTGEVLVGDDGDRPGVLSGEVVREAERLAQRAEPGEILVADMTAAFGSGVLELAAGKRGSRLVAVPRGRRSMESRAGPLVGRKKELDALRVAFARAESEPSPVLVTVLGEPGIGKTRLAQEFASAVDGAAMVVTGRCLSYGEGITFWPLREVISEAERLRGAALHELLGGERDAQHVVEPLEAALGAEGGVGSVEEIFSAARRLLETLARRRPLVVVLDDLQWAEPAFLDLVEHVAERAGGPMLLVCLGRPELLELRPEGLGEVVSLGPLSDAEVDGLIEALGGNAAVGERVKGRVKDIVEGNPLFLEQVVASLANGRLVEAEIVLPPSIDMLLASRLERLGPGERRVIERAAIAGTEFKLDDVCGLLPNDACTSADGLLQGLIRRRIVRAQPDGGYRFEHVLMQNAVYRSVPKSLRATLHESFARLLDEREEARAHPEIPGYHLEQAFHCRKEVAGQRDPALGQRASAFLGRAAARAAARQDVHAAAKLCSRAIGLLDEDDPRRIRLLPTLEWALQQAGDLSGAERVVNEAIDAAERAGDARSAAYARLELTWLREAFLHTATTEDLRREASAAIEVFDACGDERGLAWASLVLNRAEMHDGHALAAEKASQQASAHGRRAADPVTEAQAIPEEAIAAALGPRPVSKAVRRCEELLEHARGDPVTEAAVGGSIGLLRALSGRFDEARRLVAPWRAVYEELCNELSAAWVSKWIGLVEVLAENWPAAEHELRPAVQTLTRLGAKRDAAWAGGLLALALCGQRRYEEGREVAELALVSVLARRPFGTWALAAKAQALTGLGRLHEAEGLARDALAIADRTDLPVDQATARVDLAEILLLTGDHDKAAALLADAVTISSNKEDVVSASRARDVQERLG